MEVKKTMPNSIKATRKQRKQAAIRGVVLFVLLQLACIVCFASLCFIPDLPGWTVTLFAALAVICLIPMILALVVLKQRFREIEGGELDEARQY